jgi:hypothetical protein
VDAANAGLRLPRAAGRAPLREASARRETGFAAGFPLVVWPLRKFLVAAGFALCRPLAPLAGREWPFERKRFPLEKLLAAWDV